MIEVSLDKLRKLLHVCCFEAWLDVFLLNNAYILKLRRNYRKFSKPILILTLPYIIVNWLIRTFYHNSIGKARVAKILKRERLINFNHEVVIVAIAKNEGLYLREWLEFHRMVGISKIYFYDNESSDNTEEIIKPYIEEGFVEYTYMPGIGKQLDAYNDAIRRHRNDCRYMAFIDLDEYIMPEIPYSNIGECINKILSKKSNAVGIALNWCLYGNSGHDTRPKGLITENYINRADETNPMNHMVKTVCNPRMVKDYISPHYPQYLLGAISMDSTGTKRSKGWFCRDLTFKNLRLNHYYCKSREDYIIKTSRGLGDRAGHYDLSKYDKMNFNDVHDESMLSYKTDLYKALLK
ncbi:MAG: glycosyltransferase family 92 protein [Bacteroidales bacterium]|nr:glycosyltransferase family 92 protein [Bacteroidales bacterium]